ncbi:MAG TPA: translesion error-prone DNA polymerase V autoproteolytic subunit [Pyrinomonadaceae bacterium]|jgi:DNA polymerase V|nr:translesion error-prone DNA polymerase V autoproteolytic subunit [Pyrinomonadaceae bacterium]
MQCTVVSIYEPKFSLKIYRPLFSSRVAAGFPSPAEHYIEGRINLNEILIEHQLATFFIRVIGDSMSPEICEGELLVVDRMADPANRDIVVARIGDDLCVKRLRVFPDKTVYLMSENLIYQPILLTPEMDYEIWGVVLHSIKSFRKSSVRKNSKGDRR